VTTRSSAQVSNYSVCSVFSVGQFQRVKTISPALTVRNLGKKVFTAPVVIFFIVMFTLLTPLSSLQTPFIVMEPDITEAEDGAVILIVGAAVSTASPKPTSQVVKKTSVNIVKSKKTMQFFFIKQPPSFLFRRY
jgi:hypothetical protein